MAGRAADGDNGLAGKAQPAMGTRLPRRLAVTLLAALLLAALLPLAACGAGSHSEPPPGDAGSTQAPGAASRTGATKTPDAAKPAPARMGATAKGASRADAPASPTRIAFVDVGQGDAILIKSGDADVLIDGGPEGADGRVGSAMRALGMRELDTILVTHAHADHAGATDDLARRFDPDRILLAGPCDPDVKRAAGAAGAKLVQVRGGDTRRWGAVRARVLSPGRLSHDANADSVVLLLDVAGRRILLTGDLTGSNEDRVARLCVQGKALYALKVSHHGSRYATSAGFLAATDPRFAVISVGRNSYGHPTAQTLGRLRGAGARVYTTRRNGTITLTIAPSGSVAWRFAHP